MLSAAALLMTLLWAPAASAACTVSSSGVAFGSFSPLTDSTVDATGTITVNCDISVTYTLALSTGGSGGYAPRRMASGGNTMEYNLFRNATFSEIWGDSNGNNTYTVDGLVLLGNRNHTVYGRIPLSTQRTVMVGSYSDSITITVTF